VGSKVKILLLVIIVLAMLIVGTYLLGMLLPVKHQVSVSKSFNLERAALWRILRDFSAYPTWRSDIKQVQRLPDMDAAEVWLESDSHANKVAYRNSEVIEEQKLKRVIVSENLPYAGSWTFLLEQSGSASTLTITEEGEVYNAFFRVLGKYLFGFDSSMRRFLDDLAREVERQG